jgi:hypothetical protein
MKFILLLYFILVNFSFSLSFNFLRFKRDGDLFGQLSQVIQQIAAPLAGNNQKPTQSDPSFFAGPGSGSNGPPRSQAGPHPPQKSIGDAVGYCNQSPQACSYLACMGNNFKNNNNLKAGSKVLSDPDLRSAIANDPAVLKEACSKAGLNDNGCANFKMILGFADKVDPKSLHTNDEPRNKRSPFDDYGSHGGSPKSAPSSSSGASSSSSNSNSGASKSSSGSGSKSNAKPPGKGSGSDYDYHEHGNGTPPKSASQTGGSKGTGQGQGQGQGSDGEQKDCEAMMFHGQSGNNGNNNNFNNNNSNNNFNAKSRVKNRRG